MTPAELEALVGVVVSLLDMYERSGGGAGLADEARYVGEEIARWLGTEAPAVERVIEVVEQTLAALRTGGRQPLREGPALAQAVAALVPPSAPENAPALSPDNFDQKMNAMWDQLDREALDVPMTVPATPAAIAARPDTLPPDTLPEVPPTDPETPLAKGMTTPAAGGPPAGEPVRVPPVPAPPGTPTLNLSVPEKK